jgi:uncharacterized protein
VNKLQKFALITGGSQGLGKCIAQQFAQRGIPVLLVALPTPELIETQELIKKTYEVETASFGIDLTDLDAAEKVFQWCKQNNFEVQYLVNNAGFGYTGSFNDFNIVFFEKMILLNNLVMTKLVHLFLPTLKNHSESYILNIASMAALYDMPFKAVYSASKKFVYVFSRTMREELRGTSVSVSVICPSGVATNPAILESIKKIGFWASFFSSSPEQIAEISVKAMFAKKAFVVPRFTSKLYASLRHILPYNLKIWMIGRFLRKKVLQK